MTLFAERLRHLRTLLGDFYDILWHNLRYSLVDWNSVQLSVHDLIVKTPLQNTKYSGINHKYFTFSFHKVTVEVSTVYRRANEIIKPPLMRRIFSYKHL